MDTNRSLSLRQHRIIANFCAGYAWKNNADCVALSKSALGKILKISTFKSSRLQWLYDDIKPWFPYHESLWANSTFSSLLISRVSFEGFNLGGRLSTSARVIHLNKQGLKSCELQSAMIPNESEIISKMALVASGLDTI